jgi:hypothetical protein
MTIMMIYNQMMYSDVHACALGSAGALTNKHPKETGKCTGS